MKDLAYFISLGLTQEQSQKAFDDYVIDIEAAQNTAVDNKNAILKEKKDLQAMYDSMKNELGDFKTRQTELEEKAKHDEVASLFASGKIDEAKELMKNTLLADHNESLNKYKSEVESERESFLKQIKEKDASIYNSEFEKSFQKIALQNELFDKSPGALEILKQRAVKDFELDGSTFKFKDDSALINGEKVTPEAWINSTVKEEYPFLFAQVGGSGAANTPGAASGGKIDEDTYNNMTSAQRKEAVRNGNI